MADKPNRPAMTANGASGRDEAACHLSDEETEQGQKGAAVDISRNQAQEQRSRSCAWSRLFLLLGHVGYLRVERDPKIHRPSAGVEGTDSADTVSLVKML
jgi:hypothetical protein